MSKEDYSVSVELAAVGLRARPLGTYRETLLHMRTTPQGGRLRRETDQVTFTTLNRSTEALINYVT